jgi:uncharacterized membrane protein YfcA
LPDTLQIILLLLTGALGGFMSGLLGVGGGIIFVPVIDYYLQKQGINGHLLVNLILANSLATIVFTGAAGSIKQFKLGKLLSKRNNIYCPWRNFYIVVCFVLNSYNNFLFQKHVQYHLCIDVIGTYSTYVEKSKRSQL